MTKSTWILKAKIRNLIIISLTSFSLVGCGATTNTSPAPVIPTYTKLSTILLNEEKTVDAMSVGYRLSGTFVDDSGTRGLSIDAASTTAVDYSSQANLSYNNDGTLRKISIATEAGTTTWDTGVDRSVQGVDDNFGVGIFIASKQADSDTGNGALFVNPATTNTLNYQYQTFGTWIEADVLASGRWSSKVSAVSIGTPTASVSIPTFGATTFRGYTTGMWIPAASNGQINNARLTVSQFILNVNFLSNNSTFLTTNTHTYPSRASASDLNITGALTYDAISNTLSGGATTESGMTGSVSGRFYGPAAEEVGGVFTLSNGASTYAGAFGGN
ncbi:transferrin-binding protein-like solute binding protein [Oceanospirillaceae bacterium]|nr:transferrin-binding protein-like solute binding protein [Oceanospirillaceae bacterium]